MTSSQAKVLLKQLSEIAYAGPLPAIGHGSTSVGMTLLNALNIEYSSVDKPRFMGIVVSARRQQLKTSKNRVNLFARVPNWVISNCKSSEEILYKYGYKARDGTRKLYCTVRARHPNTQGLFLKIDKANGTLHEKAMVNGAETGVAAWILEDLESRLLAKHPESMWVRAVVSKRGNREYFHYREALHTTNPKVELLQDLLAEGTVTVDHLIQRQNKRTTEKGPLFKIKPINIEMLFPNPQKYDLLSID